MGWSGGGGGEAVAVMVVVVVVGVVVKQHHPFVSAALGRRAPCHSWPPGTLSTNNKTRVRSEGVAAAGEGEGAGGGGGRGGGVPQFCAPATKRMQANAGRCYYT